MPGKQGLLHISEVSWKRLDSLEGVLAEGDKVKIQLVGTDPKTGKLRLSRKVLMPKPEGYVEPEKRERREGGGDRDRRSGGGDRRQGGDRGDRRQGGGERRDNRAERPQREQEKQAEGQQQEQPQAQQGSSFTEGGGDDADLAL